jgi:hypothetical protein
MDHYYRILGLEPGATPAALKSAHRDLAQVWHPDRFTSNPRLQKFAQEKLREINDAYARLSSTRRVRPVPPSPRQPAPKPHPVEPPAGEPAPAAPVSAKVSWLYIGLQTTGVAVAILTLILSVNGFHRWLTERPAAVAVAPLPDSPADKLDEAVIETRAARPAPVHPVSARASEVQVANGDEIIDPCGRPGAGSLTIGNQTDLDAVAILFDHAVPAGPLRMIYISAGHQATIGEIGPGVYRLKLISGEGWSSRTRDFARNRTLPKSAGPFSFTQIQSPGQVRGDQYKVVLRHDPVEAAVP